MSQEITFGIVGGYGATGRAVVSELLKSEEGEILAGGLDPVKLTSLEAQFGPRVSTAPLDVLDDRSLDEFCNRCSIVVNCAGPVKRLQDRVAQAAFRRHCHYVDPAGMSVVKERMLCHDREITDRGLSFVVSAGWTPGVTELLPVYAHACAAAKMDPVESVNVYFADYGDWSVNALRDGIWFLHQSGVPRPGYFCKGRWARAKMSEASLKIDMGAPVGLRRFSLFSMPELNEVGRRLTDCNFLTYSYLAGFQNAVAALMLGLLPLSEATGVRLLRNMFRRNHLPVGGFVAVQVFGRSEAANMALRAWIGFDDGRDYWMNGVVLATAARMTATGHGIRSGVHFLYDSVDPILFMAELRKSGVQQTETWEVRA